MSVYNLIIYIFFVYIDIPVWLWSIFSSWRIPTARLTFEYILIHVPACHLLVQSLRFSEIWLKSTLSEGLSLSLRPLLLMNSCTFLDSCLIRAIKSFIYLLWTDLSNSPLAFSIRIVSARTKRTKLNLLVLVIRFLFAYPLFRDCTLHYQKILYVRLSVGHRKIHARDFSEKLVTIFRCKFHWFLIQLRGKFLYVFLKLKICLFLSILIFHQLFVLVEQRKMAWKSIDILLRLEVINRLDNEAEFLFCHLSRRIRIKAHLFDEYIVDS